MEERGRIEERGRTERRTGRNKKGKEEMGETGSG